jgi:hypothetical protein
MVKSIILIVSLTFLIVSTLQAFLSKLDNSSDFYDSKAYTEPIDWQYMDTNGYGDKILCFEGLTEKNKKEIWKDSFLNKEMLALFPRFIEMQKLVETRLLDDGKFKKALIERIVSMEKDYIGGLKSERSVKLALSEL